MEIEEPNIAVLGRPEVEMKLMIGDHCNLTIYPPPSPKQTIKPRETVEILYGKASARQAA